MNVGQAYTTWGAWIAARDTSSLAALERSNKKLYSTFFPSSKPRRARNKSSSESRNLMKNPNDAVDYILRNSAKFAKAKAQRVYLEEFRKSKKAILMSQSDESTAVAREQSAYSHPEYLELLDGLKAAVEVEEKLRFELIAAQLRVDIWRSTEASNRMQDKATQ